MRCEGEGRGGGAVVTEWERGTRRGFAVNHDSLVTSRALFRLLHSIQLLRALRQPLRVCSRAVDLRPLLLQVPDSHQLLPFDSLAHEGLHLWVQRLCRISRCAQGRRSRLVRCQR